MRKPIKQVLAIALAVAFLILIIQPRAVFAQDGCSSGSGGSCIVNETAPAGEGNYTYPFCSDLNNDNDTLDSGECTNSTLRVFSSAVSVFVSPDLLDFGRVLAGEGAVGTVVITNTGNETIFGLTQQTADSRLATNIDTADISPQETAVLSALLTTTATDIANSFLSTISVSGTADNKNLDIAIPVQYEIYRNDTNVTRNDTLGFGILSAVPDTVNFGTLTPGASTTQLISIINDGDAVASGIAAFAPSEITATIDADTLTPGAAASLELLLIIPANLEKGEYDGTVDVISAEGASVSIPIAYTIGTTNVFCPVVTVPSCPSGSHYETRKDANGCASAVCVSDSVKKECPIVEPPVCSENEQLKSSADADGCKSYSCVPKPPLISKENLLSPGVLITLIIIIAATLFMIFVLAVREGWIDLNDYPLLRDWIRKAGLGPLFEREVEVSRFTPKPPPVTGFGKPPVKPPSPPSAGTQVRRQLTPAEKEKLEKYMKDHPEYAAWVKKRYGLK